MKRLILELRRRDVLRMAAFYVVGAWVTVQVAALLFAGWEVPEAAIRFVWLAVFAGFPIALVFSWRYDVTTRGILRTPERDAGRSDPALSRNDHLIIAGLTTCALVVAGIASLSVVRSVETETLPMTSEAPEKSVAILAFEDLSPDGENDWISNGVIDEVLHALARLPELQVTARTSSFYFRDRNIPVPEIAAVLGVRHVVEGSILRVGDDLEVSYHVIQARDGFRIYSDKIDGRVDDLFGLREYIAEHIAEALDVVLDDGKREQMFAMGTRDIDAYQSYLRGTDISYRWMKTGNVDDLREGFRWYSAAIDADPEFSFAYIARANIYQRFLEGLYPPTALGPEYSQQIVRERMRADFANASRYAIDPAVRVVSDIYDVWLSEDYSDLPGLAARFDPVTASYIPDNLDIFGALALISIAGHADKALTYADNRILRAPLDDLGYNQAAGAAKMLGDFDAALEYLVTAQEKVGRSVFTEHNLLMHHIVTGNVKRALELASLERTGLEEFRLPLRAMLLYADGRAGDAISVLDSIGSQGDGAPYYAMALRMAGREIEARRVYTEIDRAPGANLVGTYTMIELAGALPVPPKWMPEYATRLAEAGINASAFELPAGSD